MKEQINTILKAIGLKAEEIKLMEAKLKDGVTVIEADPDFEAGATVMVMTEDGQAIPVPVSGEGEAYELEDGRIFSVVEEGIIAEIKEAGTEEEEEVTEEVVEEEVEEVEASEETPLPKAIIESIVKETKFSKQDSLIEALTAEITELKSQLEESNKVEEVELSDIKPIAHNPEPQKEVKLHTYGNKGTKGVKDSVMSKIAKLK